MDNFALTCCSTADLPAEFFETRKIPFAKFHFHMNDRDYPDDLGASIPFSEFYEMIRKGAMPTTSQVNVEDYIAMFEPILREGRDVLHITLSSGISGTYNSACAAADQIKDQYPDRKLYIVDSLCASTGYGLLMEYLSDMKDSGKTIDECRDWAEENKLNIHHVVMPTNLTSLLRGGRLSAASYAVGSILGICPIIEVNDEGKLVPRAKIRTKKKAMQELVNRMEAHAAGGLSYDGKCAIAQSDCMEDAIALKDLIEKKFPNLKDKVEIDNIGTVIGSHTGPGTLVVFFMGDRRQR